MDVKRIAVLLTALLLSLGLVFVGLTMAHEADDQPGPDAETEVADDNDIEVDHVAQEETSEAQPDALGDEPARSGAGGGVYPLFVGNDTTTIPQVQMDVLTGDFITAFVGVDAWGAAYDAVNRKLYHNDGSTLYEWSGGAPVLLGTITDGVMPLTVHGLAFYEDTLYASSINTDQIYTIDLGTLVATSIITLVDTSASISGLAIDPSNGDIYGTDDIANTALVRINNDGTLTVIAAYPAGETDVDGLAISPDRKAYLITDDPTPAFFNVYDLNAMAYTDMVAYPWGTNTAVQVAGAWIEQPVGVFCRQPNLAIPDNDPVGVNDSLVIASSETVTDVNIYLNVSHTWVGDLAFTMTHEASGTSVAFIDRPGVPASSLGCSQNDIDATINDEGTDGNVEDECNTGAPAIQGDFVGGDPPNNSLLAAFDGLPLNGSWTLHVADKAGGDIGTVNEWCLVAASGTPEMGVDPSSLASSQPANTQVVQALTLSNGGDASLNWTMLEETAVPIAPVAASAPAVTLVQPPIVQSVADCAQYENYAGVEPAGYARYCMAHGRQPWASHNLDPTDSAYALDIGFVSDNLVSHALNDFPGQTVVGANAQPIFAMDFDQTGTILYAIDNTSRELGTLDLATGAFSPIALVSGIPGGDNISGLTIDPATGTAYVSGLGAVMTLYRLDLNTGVATIIGSDATVTLLIDIAMGPQGILYGHDISTDSIYTIDTSTGAATLVGPTGVDSNFAQGMDFDNTDGTLYAYTYQGGGANQYGTIDLATGTLIPLAIDNPQGEFEGATQTVMFACDNPADIPWLSTGASSGAIPASGSDVVDVTFDSAGLATGTYTGTLCIQSNDPVNPILRLPLTLTVLEYGVEIGAVTDALTGTAGSPVVYTVYVTNSGQVSSTFSLSVSGNSWPTSLSVPDVTLDVGQSASVMVTVDIPAGTADGDMDVVTVTVVSDDDPGSTDSVMLVTTALEPSIYLPMILKLP